MPQRKTFLTGMKKHINAITFNLLLLLLCFHTQAQDTLPVNLETRQSKHALGLLGSMDSGLGISYRYTHNNFRVQASTLPTYVNFGSGFYLQFVGLALQYRFFSRNRFDLYSYLGNNISFAIIDDGFYLMDNISGIGTGVDFRLSTKWMLQFQMGYGFVSREKLSFFDGVTGFISPGLGVLFNFGSNK